MKVLHVTDSYRPATGGLENAVSAIAHASRRRGLDVGIVTLGRPDAPADEMEGQVRVRRIDGWSRHLRRFAHDNSLLFHPTAPDPGLIRQLQSILDRERPAVVHAHGWALHSCLALRLPPGGALVVTLHDHGLRCAKKSLVHRARLDEQCPGPALGRCLRCARAHYGTAKGAGLVLGLAESHRRLDRIDIFLPISQAVARACLDGVAPERVRVVPSFVPDSLPAELDAAPRPSFVPDGPFVLYVGALSCHKGVDTLVQAQRRMGARVPLVLLGPPHSDIGDTSDFARLRVITPGAVAHPQVMAAFRAATVAVVPSRWPEPQGLVAVEAMTAGAALVASRVGGLPEVVSADTGLLVPPGDPEALAAAIGALLDDPACRDRMRSAARRRALAWTESAVLPRLLDAYAAALANAGGDRRRRPPRAATAQLAHSRAPSTGGTP